MFDLIDLVSLSREFQQLRVLSRSTLYKLSSGHYPKNGHFSDFPPPIKLGGKTFWRKSAIQEWVDAQAKKTAVALGASGGEHPAPAECTPLGSSGLQSSPVSSRRGRPTRNEMLAAAAAGVTVREYRQHMSCPQGMQT